MIEQAIVRELPWSREAEQSVLGALMLDPAAIDQCADVVAAESFFDRGHARIFGVISTQLASGRPADVVSVFDALGDEVEQVGGMPYLNALVQSVAGAWHVRRHAEIVRERAQQRAVVVACDKAMSVAAGPGSADEKLERIAALFDPIRRGGGRVQPKQLRELLAGRIDRVSDIADGKAKPEGWATRIPALDSMLNGGLRPGGVYVLAARPSVGKSSLAEHLGLTLARDGITTLFLSQEMPEVEVADRAIANVSRLSYGDLQTGQLTNDGWSRLTEGVDICAELPFYVDDQPALTLADVRAKARMVKGLKVLILDYLQLCTGTGDNRNAQIEEISRGLKALAKQMQIAIVNLSQLNREVEKRAVKRPNLSDLRDSGSIEQDADVVMFLWPVGDTAGAHRLIGMGVDKNRQGRLGQFGLNFDGPTQRWSESAEPLSSQPKAPRGFA